MTEPWVRSEDDGKRLAGKVALVTGAGTAEGVPGIGEAIAIVLATQGAKVGILDISKERAQATEAIVAQQAGESLVLVGDVTNADDMARCVSELIDAYGRLDILVNCAAVVGGGGSPENLELDDFRKVLDIDLTSMVVVSKFAVPHMKALGSGSIVNIASIAGQRGLGGGAYTAAKAGMIGLTNEWAMLLGRDGIRVNCISVGHAYTPMGGAGISSHLRDVRLAAAPLNHEGDAWDVAWPVAFLASEEARWISGVTIPVDGGAIAISYLGGYMLNAPKS